MATIKTDQVVAKLIALYGKKMKNGIYKMSSEQFILLKPKWVVLRLLKKQVTEIENIKE